MKQPCHARNQQHVPLSQTRQKLVADPEEGPLGVSHCWSLSVPFSKLLWLSLNWISDAASCLCWMLVGMLKAGIFSLPVPLTSRRFVRSQGASHDCKDWLKWTNWGAEQVSLQYIISSVFVRGTSSKMHEKSYWARVQWRPLLSIVASRTPCARVLRQ